MSELICVTNRKLCGEDFSERLKKIADARPKAVVLREKDLSDWEYFLLAQKALKICSDSGTKLILHSFDDIAESLGCDSLHLPLPRLKKLNEQSRRYFKTLGASCHSAQDVLQAQSLGCSYVFAGHIFDTDCKRGLSGRGLDFLRGVCSAADVPVYAIGGISPRNFRSVISAGAAGACVMSGFMRCLSPADFIKQFTE